MCGGMTVGIEGAYSHRGVCFLNSDLALEDVDVGVRNLAASTSHVQARVSGWISSSANLPLGQLNQHPPIASSHSFTLPAPYTDVWMQSTTASTPLLWTCHGANGAPVPSAIAGYTPSSCAVRSS